MAPSAANNFAVICPFRAYQVQRATVIPSADGRR